MYPSSNNLRPHSLPPTPHSFSQSPYIIGLHNSKQYDTEGETRKFIGRRGWEKGRNLLRNTKLYYKGIYIYIHSFFVSFCLCSSVPDLLNHFPASSHTQPNSSSHRHHLRIHHPFSLPPPTIAAASVLSTSAPARRRNIYFPILYFKGCLVSPEDTRTFAILSAAPLHFPPLLGYSLRPFLLFFFFRETQPLFQR